jgi:hypothetical protein
MQSLAIHGGAGMHSDWREIRPRVAVHEFLMRETKKTKKTENSLFFTLSPTLSKMYINHLFKGKIRFPSHEERNLLLYFCNAGSLDSLVQLFLFFYSFSQNFCSSYAFRRRKVRSIPSVDCARVQLCSISKFWCTQAHSAGWLDSYARASSGLAREQRCARAHLFLHLSVMPWHKTLFEVQNWWLICLFP